MRPIWTIPLAALVTGLIGYAFGFPALRLAGVSLALATFARRRVAAARSRNASRSSPAAAAGSQPPATETPVRAGHLDAALALLRGLGDARDCSCSSPGCSCAAASAARGARSATARSRRFRPASARRCTRRFAFGISSAFAGVAGALFAIQVAYVNPDTFPCMPLDPAARERRRSAASGRLTGVLFGAMIMEFLPIYAQEPPFCQAPLEAIASGGLRRHPDRDHVPASRRRRLGPASAADDGP